MQAKWASWTCRRGHSPAEVAGKRHVICFFAGPPQLGFVAEYFGQRWSYWTVVPVVVAALVSSKALERNRVSVICER
jgi:hypothetical protein